MLHFILGGGDIHNVLRNILVYIFTILFSNDAQQILFNSASKNGQENGTET